MSDFVHVSRGGAIIGKYPLQDMPVLLGAGTVLLTDYFWQEGMARWELVSSRFQAPNVPPPVAKPPASLAGTDRFYCLRCKSYFPQPVERRKGSFMTEVFYWMVSPIAGGLYAIGNEMSKTQHCPRCNSRQIREEVW